MYKYFVVLLGLITLAWANQGGNKSYNLMWTDSRTPTDSTISFNWLDARDGTAIFNNVAGNLDQLAGPISLPFTFSFYGTHYNSVYVSSNGFISFYPSAGAAPTNLSLGNINAADSLIAVYWDDLDADSISGENAYYKTVGTAPYRRFVVQWDNFRQVNTGKRITFEAIFYETSNLIQFQYLTASTVPADSTDGGSATIGVGAISSNNLQYSFNSSGTIAPQQAILFHPKQLGSSALAAISPTSVNAGTVFRQFTYKLSNIDVAGDSLKMGKVNRLAIANPFASSTPIVTGIKVNSKSVPIQNSSDYPSSPGLAHWQYLSGSDSIIIKTFEFEVRDSLVVTFLENIPQNLSTGNQFVSRYDARLDSTGNQLATDAGWSVAVVGGDVVSYEFSPASNQTITAGDNVSFTVTARDIYGNGVLNNDTVVFSISGSSTAQFVSNDSLIFAGDSVVTVTVRDTVAGSFTLIARKAGNSLVSGQSGLITVQNGPADHFVIVSSQGSITVGGSRLLQVRLEDAYNNVLADSSVRYRRLHGNGLFGGSSADTTILTNSSGLAEMDYTASTQTAFVRDSLEVSIGLVKDTLVLPLTAGEVSYYSFAPSVDSTIVAGSSISYTITARDVYGNAKPNNDTATLSVLGSSTAVLSAASVNFSGGSTATFSVSDTVAGSFSVVAQKSTDSSIKGQSGLITVQNGPADHFVIVSSQGSITVGGSRLLQVRLEDAYNNVLADSSVRYRILHGNGLFGGSSADTTVLTNSSGLAEMDYTASTQTTFVRDSLEVSIGLVKDTLVLPLTAGEVSYYSFAPSADSTIVAGNSISYTITARDVYGNAKPNNDTATLSVLGSSTAVLSAASVNFSGGSTATFSVSDTVAGSFSVVAQKSTDSSIKGQSGLITVQNGPADHFVIVSSQGSITVGGSRLLQVRLEDAYNNVLADSTVRYRRLHGNGLFGGSSADTTVLTNSSGLAEMDYTASTQTTFVRDSLEVSIGLVKDTLVLPLTAGEVSYYSFAPSVDSTVVAGNSISYTITARDVYGNAKPNNDTATLSVLGSSTAVLSTASVNFSGGSTATFSVSDTVAGSFRVKAVQSSNSFISGESGIITVTAGSPNQLVALTALSDTVTVGNSKNISVKLVDAYNNPISAANLFFQVRSGSGTFTSNSKDTLTSATDASGEVTVSYRVSTSSAGVRDSVQVSYGLLSPLVFVTALTPDSISYYTIVDSLGTYNYSAGDTVYLKVRGYDVYNNLAVNSSRSITLSSSASRLKNITAATANLQTGTHVFTVLDSAKESGITFTVSDAYGKSATSASFVFGADSLYRLRLFSQANEGGVSYSQRADTLTADQSLTLYAAGYDRFDNYIGDIDSAGWFTTGGLQPALNGTSGKFVTFSPTASGVSGQILARISTTPGIVADSTGTILVQGGSIASVKIVLDSNGSNELGDTTVTAGNSVTAYAAAFDSDGNFLQLVPANWSISPGTIANFAGGDSLQNGTSALITANKTGNGKISITYSGLSDQSGLWKTRAGSASYITIRTAPNNGGLDAGSLAFTITTDSSLTFYAAHYDARGNYLGDQAVTWDTLKVSGNGLSGYSTAASASLFLNPTLVGAGRLITTSGSLVNDTTGVVTVNRGDLYRIAIRNGKGESATEVGRDTVIAGSFRTYYSAGFDKDNNFRGLAKANWSFAGGTLGTLSGTPDDSVTFNATTRGVTIIKAVSDTGSYSDVTSEILVKSGNPAAIFKIAETDSQSGVAGSQLVFPIKVQVKDALGNPVSGDTIQWKALAGGLLSGTISVTDTNGYAQTTWTLHDTISTDSVSAKSKNFLTNPDSVVFYGFPQPQSNTTLSYVNLSDTLRSGAVMDTVGPFRVVVRDSLNNPVANHEVSFAVTSHPNGAAGEKLTHYTVLTNTAGQAETYLILGSRLGDYTVTAYANTTPSQLTFTGRASTPAAADSIAILSGNSQTDTVGQQMPNAIVLKLMDAYQNPLADSLLTFILPDGGSLSATEVTTDANGKASVAWTLGTTPGTYRMVARLKNKAVYSDTVTATAVADAPAALAFGAIRKVSSDSLAVLPGEAVELSGTVSDQYGNLLSNQTVQFEIVQGSGASLQSSSVSTNSAGEFINYIRIDRNFQENIARAFISGVDTVAYHLFTVSYVAGSLQPTAVERGDTVGFSLQIQNPAPGGVRLDTSAAGSYLTFGDGAVTITAALLNDTLAPGANLLSFKPAWIDTNLIITNYQPEINLKGRAADSYFSGTLNTGTDRVHLTTVELVAASVDSPLTKQVRRGNRMLASLLVRNTGNVKISIDPATGPVLKDALGNEVAANFQRVTSDTIIPPDSSLFRIDYRWDVPANFDVGSFTLDGRFYGKITSSSAAINDLAATTTDTLKIISQSDISVVAGTLSPSRLTSGDSAEFALQIQNSGEADVVLSAANSYLTFGQDTIYLANSQTVSGNGSLTLNFSKKVVLSAARSLPYPVTLSLSGTENGAAYSRTIAVSSDSVRVDALPANAAISLFAFSADTVGQGEDSIAVTITVSNPQILNAGMKIASPDDIQLVGSGSIQLTPQNYSVSDFPLIIAGGELRTFTALAAMDAAYPAGADTIWSRIDYSDANTATAYTLEDSSQNKAVRVLSKAQLQIVQSVLTPDTVSQGQTGVLLHLFIKNNGESSAQITDAPLSFLNRNTVVAEPAYPILLAGGDTTTLLYNISIDSSAALGIDPVSAALNYRDVRSGATTQLASQVVDSLFIQSFNSKLVQIISVSVPAEKASAGQHGVAVSVKIQNQGQAAIRLDSLRLFASPQVLRDSLSNSLPVIAGKSNVNVSAWLNIPDSVLSVVDTIDARIKYTDLNSGASYARTGANVTDLLTLQQPPSLQLALTPSSRQLSVGQSYDLTAQLSNLGEADVENGALAVQLPAGYSLLSPSPVGFNSGDTSITFTIRGDVAGDAVPDTIMVYYSQPPQDVNSGSPAILLNDSATATVNVDSALTVLSNLQITAPQGALDDTVSTEQTFTLQQIIRFGGSVSDSNRVSELLLPAGAGFAVVSNTTQSLRDGVSRDTLEWQVKAPQTATGPSSFVVKTTVKDRNTGATQTVYSDTVSVVVVGKAKLALSSGIVAPAGATDGIVSTYQYFDLEVSISNNGSAGVLDSNEVEINLGSGYRFSSSNWQDTIKVVNLGGTETRLFRIWTDSLSHSLSRMTVKLTSAALDENSSQSAFVVTDSVSVNIRTVKRADLQVSLTPVDSVSQGTRFTLSGMVRNLGEAGLEPGDSVWVALRMDTSKLRLVNPSDSLRRVKLVNRLAELSWQVESRQDTGQFNLTAVIDTLVDSVVKDENNNYAGIHAWRSQDRDIVPVKVVSGGQLQIDSVVVAADQVYRGQSGISASVYLRNGGAAPVRLKSLALQSSNSGISAALVNTLPDSLKGWENRVVEYRLDVSAAAPLGLAVLDAVGQAVEISSGQIQNATAVVKDSIEVLNAPVLRISRVSTDYDSVNLGQKNISLSVILKNTGGVAFDVDTVRLSFTRGTYSGIQRVFPSNLRVAAGATETVLFNNVAVDSASSLGQAIINASVRAVNVVTGQRISVSNADTTDVWQVVAPANLLADTFTPSAITTGQSASFNLIVKNSGGSGVYLDPDSTRLEIGSEEAALAQTLFIPANSQRTLTFPARAWPLAAGDFPVQLQLRRYTENLAVKTDTLTFGLLSVQETISLDTGGVRFPALVSNDSTLDINLNLSNRIGAAAALLDSLSINSFNYSWALADTLGGGSQLPLTLPVPLNNNFAGNYSLPLKIYYRDANTSETDSVSFLLGAVKVLKHSDVQLVDLSGPAAVYQGQTGQQLNLRLVNSGESTAQISAVNLLYDIGLYTVSGPAVPFYIQGGDTATVILTVDIRDSSAIGLDRLGVGVTYSDSLSGKPYAVQQAEMHSWRIYQQNGLEILSVNSGHLRVSAGETNAVVSVRIRNSGSYEIVLDSVAVISQILGDNNYQFNRVSALPVVAAGQTVDIGFTANISATASLGVDSLNAFAAGRRIFPGGEDSLQVNGSNNLHSWIVERRPSLVTDSLAIAPAQLSVGQNYVPLMVSVSYPQTTTYMADAVLDSVIILANGVKAQETGFSLTRQSVLPQVLNAGATTTLNYKIRPELSIIPGEYIFSTRLYYRDVNDNFPKDTLLTNLDTVRVETPSGFTFSVPQVSQNQTHWGRLGDTLSVTIKNSGGAAVRLLSAQTDVSGKSFASDIQRLLLSPALPVIINSGDSTQARFILNYPAAPPEMDTVQYRLRVSGEDLNSSATLNDTSGWSGDVIVHTPPAIEFVAGSLTPGRVDTQKIGVVFRLKVVNSGSADLVLSAGQTSLGFPEFPAVSALLDSPAVIRGNDTTTLKFAPVNLTMPNGDYLSELQIVGSYHGDAYSKVLNGDLVSMGGAITIRSLQFPDLPINRTITQGDTGIRVLMEVQNFTSDTLQIRNGNTGLVFRRANSDTLIAPTILNLRRVDTLTRYPASEITYLEFKFDVPVGAVKLGDYWVEGYTEGFAPGISDTTRTAPDALSFKVISSAKLSYSPGTLSPALGIPGQQVVFRAMVRNTGLALVQLDKDSSYLRIESPSEGWQSNLDASYLVPAQDSTRLGFREMILPAAAAGYYDLKLRLKGSLQTGDSFDTTIVATSEFQLLESAQLVVDSLSVDFDKVVPGQENIPVRWYVRNVGESVAELLQADLKFTDSSGNNIDNQFILSGRSVNLPQNVTPGAFEVRDTIDVAAQAASGPVNVGLSLRYRDTLTPSTIVTYSVSNLDLLTVLTSGNLFIDSTGVENLPHSPYVNAGQNFDVITRVNNNGGEPLERIRLKLYRENTLIDSTSILSLSSGQVVWKRFNVQAPQNSGPQLYRTVIDSAFSAITGLPVPIAPNTFDHTEQVIVEQPARLQLTLTPPSRQLSVGQSYDLTAQLSNLGEADVENGALAVQLPAGYSLLSPSPVGFNSGDTSITFTIRGDAAGDAIPDTIMVYYSQLPQDVNSGSPAILLNDSATATVNVDSALTVLSNLQITAPLGALDDTVSTEQTFTLQQIIRFGGSVSDSNRVSELLLPAGAGFAVVGNTTQSLRDGVSRDTLEWQVKAPLTATGPSSFVVKTTVKDRNTGATQTIYSDTVSVVVVGKAKLALSSGIVAPAGATDGIVSTYQYFDLEVSISNNGSAGVLDSNEVEINLGNGYRFSSSNWQDTIKVVNLGGTETRLFRVWTDSLSHSLSRMTVKLTSAALDENSNQSAFVVTDSVSVNIRTVKRADLQVSLTPVDSVSQGTRFTLSGMVRNLGEAGLEPGDSVWVALRMDTSKLRLVNPSDSLRRVKLVNRLAELSWQVESRQDTGQFNLTAVMDTLVDSVVKDENNNYAGKHAWRSQDRDTVAVKVLPSGEISVDSLRIVWPEGGTDDTLSTGQNFRLKAWIHFMGNIRVANRQARITVPLDSGFALLDSSLKTLNGVEYDTVSWLIRAPEELLARQKSGSGGKANPEINAIYSLKVRAFGFENVTGKLKSATRKRPIVVQTAPILALSAGIVEPAGALDGVVSTRQSFLMKFRMLNAGTAGLADSSEIRLSLPPGFSFSAAQADSQVADIKLAAPDSLLARIYTGLSPTALSPVVAKVVSPARDVNTGAPAALQNDSVLVNMNIVKEARLQVNIQLSDSVVTQNQNLVVSGNLQNVGQAGILPDNQVRLRLLYNPLAFDLQPGDSLYRVVEVGNAFAPWELISHAGFMGQDTIQVVIDEQDNSYDANKYSDSLAIRIPSPKKAVVVENPGNLKIMSVQILNQQGASKQTLSTNQRFTVKAVVGFYGAVSDSGRTARIILPEGKGYRLESPALVGLTGVQDTAVWSVQAPEALQAGTGFAADKGRGGTAEGKNSDQILEGILSQIDPLRIQARAVERNTGVSLLDQKDTTVVLQERARLAVQAEILAPAGAKDQVVSTNQMFEVQVSVLNTGEAGTIGTSRVTGKLPAGFSFDPENPVPESEYLLETGQVVVDTIYTGGNAAPPDTIRFLLSEAALDSNSGEQAVIGSAERLFSAMQIVPRADLQIRTISAPDTVNIGQEFRIRVLAENIGNAGVLPEDSVYLKVEYNPNMVQLLSPQDSTRFGLSDTASYQFQALSQSGPENIKFIIKDPLLYDENNYPDVKVFKSDSTVTNTVEILDQGEFNIASFVFVPEGGTSRTVSSFQDSIQIELTVQNDPYFTENRTAQLLLPAGFSSINNLVQNIPEDGIVRWYITASQDSTTGFETIRALASATSRINGQTVQKEADLSIKVVQRAEINLLSKIIAPAGAKNDTVSYGQSFTLRTYIRNLGVASLVGSGRLQLQAGDSLTIVKPGGETAKIWEQTFVEEDSLDWTIRVDENAAVSAILSRIKELQASKLANSRPAAMRADEGVQPAPFVAAGPIDNEISKLNRKLANVLVNTELVASVVEAPDDQYTQKPAFWGQGPQVHPIVVMPETELRIVQHNLADFSTVSTGQAMTISASIETTGQFQDLKSAYLHIDDFLIPDSQKVFSGESVNWNIIAPATIETGTQKQVKIVITGRDANSNAVRKDTVESVIQIQRAATVGLKLEITDPPTAANGRLAFNQEFTLRATVLKGGEASLSGSGQIHLNFNPNEIMLLDADVNKSFTWPDSVVEWRLKTPDSLINSQLQVNFLSRPLDVNTGKPALLDTLNSVALLRVLTEVHRLQVVQISDYTPPKINRQNTEKIPLLAMEFFNQKTSDFVPEVTVDSLAVTFQDESGTPLENPGLMISRIRVVNPGGYQLSKPQGEPKVFADVTLSGGEPSTVPIRFTEALTLSAGQKDTVIIAIDLAANAPNKSIQMRLSGITAYTGSRLSPIQVVDLEGNVWPQPNLGNSEVITVVSSDEQKVFGNYPNPFGEAEEFTRFVFWAEDAGTADLRIYTLMGGLVWSHTESIPNGGQLYDGLLTWNGSNNSGQKVLNGVYLAILRVKYNNGTTKIYKTKVAYIK